MEKALPVRKTTRLYEYDYSLNGAYSITICTENRKNILSAIRRGDPCGRPHTPCGRPDFDTDIKITLTELGEICKNKIEYIRTKYDISITKYVIMPNHIHMLILVTKDTRATARAAPTIGDIIGGYKSIVANEWLKICKKNNVIMGQFWQRGYHDRIIRNEKEYQNQWQYIDENPMKWVDDKYYI